jgi:hypothetical protein
MLKRFYKRGVIHLDGIRLKWNLVTLLCPKAKSASFASVVHVLSCIRQSSSLSCVWLITSTSSLPPPFLPEVLPSPFPVSFPLLMPSLRLPLSPLPPSLSLLLVWALPIVILAGRSWVSATPPGAFDVRFRRRNKVLEEWD